MKRAAELIQADGGRPRQDSGLKYSKPTLDERWTRALFAKLAARYLHKWSSAFPTEDALKVGIAEWSEVLAGLSGDDIKRGLDGWSGDWPPSATEFRNACKPVPIENEDMYKTVPKALPEPSWRKEERREKGRSAIAELMNNLGVNHD